MKNKYGMPYTPLTKQERELFADRISKLIAFEDENDGKMFRNEITHDEYIRISIQCAAERNGAAFILTALGWKYDKRTKQLVIRDGGKLI